MSTGVTAPLGFRAAAVASGIKPDRLDLALLVADAPCTAAGVFTANLAQAAPVLVSRQHLGSSRARAIVVNAAGVKRSVICFENTAPLYATAGQVISLKDGGGVETDYAMISTSGERNRKRTVGV